MILLTFVENAIKHNSLDHQSLLITINVRQTEGKMILITVSDNGRGFSSTAIEQINRGEKIYYEEVAHIGIYNVFTRLPLLYGNDSWAYVENNEKGGACIKISIPKEMKGIE